MLPGGFPCVTAGCLFCHPMFYLVTIFHGWFLLSYFISLQMYYRLFFFIHLLGPITHSSCVHSNALKIAAIVGSPENSTLLTAQPGANQKSSFAQHNSHPSRSNCSITCLLPFSLHCFFILNSFGFSSYC